MKKPRPVLRYHGGKHLLAPWIIGHFSPHRCYTEVFGGAASVLLRKARSYAEVYNDLDGDVVNLFRVLRDPASAKDLQNLLRLTPYARDEFALAYQPGADSIEQARRLIIRSFMGFGSAACNPAHVTGFRSDCNRSGTTPAHDWMNYPNTIPFFVERLQGVVIEHRAAVDVLVHHDGRETLHYVDPPYPHNTRKAIVEGRKNHLYIHEMTDGDHRALAAVLHSLSGMVILSGYACDLYDTELFPDWHRVQRESRADGARKRTEVLWLNDAAAAGLSQTSLKLDGGSL